MAPVSIYNNTPFGTILEFGYIDRTGKFVIPPQFSDAHPFSGGIAKIQDDGKYGFINRDGKLITELMFDDASDFVDGIASVKLGTRTGYIDRTGKYIWSPSK